MRGIVFALVAVCFLVPPTSAAGKKPGANRQLNILFIMTDQHNARALGCYGNKDVKTPNMDRLARQGVRFTNAFTQTGQCCPARYSTWTGRYAHSHGCRWNNVVEPLDEITIMEVLKKAGYVTAGIGKHHMMHDPRKHGMDVVVRLTEYKKFLKAENKPYWLEDGEWMGGIKHGGARVGVTNLDNQHHPAGYWTSRAIEFIRQNKDKPFFVHYSFYGPHTPYVPSRPWADMYDPDKLTLPGNFNAQFESMPSALAVLKKNHEKMSDIQLRKTLGYYYGLTSQIDYNIGVVLDELDKLGLADRTVVIYTADHGDMAGEHRTFQKTVANYDGTIRIPMIVRLPGVISAGKVRQELVGLIDLMPTLCELTGQKIPAKVQGASLIPLLQGKSADWRKVIFSEIGYPRHRHGRSAMARTHTHKYVHHENIDGGGPFEELFDMIEDPWETRNEINNPQYAGVVVHLKKEIERWEKTTDHAPMYPIREPSRPGKRKSKRSGVKR
jgi:arylsulfatase A-like enzyme